MSELIPLLETLVTDADAGRDVALCVVAETRGSTPRAPGAAMLVRADQSTQGTLGGGCVEADTARQAFQMLRSGQSGLLEFKLDSDDAWDDGLICGGNMTIAVTPVRAGTDLTCYREALALAAEREPAQFPVHVEHSGAAREYRIHVEVAPQLVIAGAGHVGQAVAQLAVGLDFDVIVIDDRADFATSTRFDQRVRLIADDIARTLRNYALDADSYVVIVTRGHRHDHQALDAVIRRDAAYIGLIGSRRKSRMILKALAEAGVAPARIEAVHTPIGLPIGAVTVPEIAVSIVAELVKVRRARLPTLVERVV